MRNRSRPDGVVIPTLIYDDVPAAVEWLCRVFGFRRRVVAGEGHAQLVVGDGGGVMLGASRAESSLVFAPPSTGSVSSSLLVTVDDVDAHHRRAVAAGARIALDPADHPFGERQYTAFDLAGHRWTFSQAIADVDPAAWGAQSFD